MNLEAKIRKLFEIARELEEMYPGRHFTPDGHMVGSLGEVYAASRYGLELFEASHPVHDAISSDGRLVQIKATQGNRIALSEKPDYLIVLRIEQDGSFKEAYNGPGEFAWNACGKVQKTGQRHIQLSRLRVLDAVVSVEDKIMPVGEPFDPDEAAALFGRWNQRLGDPSMPLARFAEDMYRAGIVVADYDDRVKGIEARDIEVATGQFCQTLTERQIIGCIAWHFRCDHFCNGSLEESVRSGAIRRLMCEYQVRRLGQEASNRDL